jgi:hypothetical protein
MDKFNRMVLGDDSKKYKGPAVTLGEKRYPGVMGVAHMMSIAGQSFLPRVEPRYCLTRLPPVGTASCLLWLDVI